MSKDELMASAVRMYRQYGERDGLEDRERPEALSWLSTVVERTDQRIAKLEDDRYQVFTTEERDAIERELAAEREYLLSYVQAFAGIETP